MDNDLLFFCLLRDGEGYNKLDDMNKIKYQMFVFFMGLLNTQFKWEGLPDEIKPYNVERILNMFGQGVLFKYGEQFVFAQAVNTSLLNIYNQPCEVQPISMNGVSFDRVFVTNTLDVNKELHEQNAVLFKNNLTSTPTYFILKPFIDSLCFNWESKGINAGLSRIKYLIRANKNIAGTIRTEIKKIIGSPTAIPVINEKMNVLDQIEKLDFNVAYEPDKYWQDFDKTFAFICQLCGITTNMSQSKKERLVVSEVESNDELTTLSEDMRLEFRKIGCEDANKLFSIKWSVDNKVTAVKATQPTDNKELNQDTDE